MAFYARSEEARQTHSAHKLALVIILIFPFTSNFLFRREHNNFFVPSKWFYKPVSYILLLNVLCILQGALALEDALSKGLPIQTEIEALHAYLDGIDKDSILDLVLSSLPEETRRTGTDTLLQLNQKASYFLNSSLHIF